MAPWDSQGGATLHPTRAVSIKRRSSDFSGVDQRSEQPCGQYAQRRICGNHVALLADYCVADSPVRLGHRFADHRPTRLSGVGTPSNFPQKPEQDAVSVRDDFTFGRHPSLTGASSVTVAGSDQPIDVDSLLKPDQTRPNRRSGRMSSKGLVVAGKADERMFAIFDHVQNIVPRSCRLSYNSKANFSDISLYSCSLLHFRIPQNLFSPFFGEQITPTVGQRATP